jgi:peptide deformylase
MDLQHTLLTVDPSDLLCPMSPLRKTSKAVESSHPGLESILNTMREVMYGSPHGRGISAIQIGEPLRICIVNMSRERDKEIIFINPTVQRLSSATYTYYEGCLSLPGYKGLVRRARRITVQAIDPSGRSFDKKSQGYEAAVIQHEIDHMNGILYWDKLESGTSVIPIDSVPRD